MIEPLKSRRFWQDFDWLLLGAALLLSLISLIEIYSSTMNSDAENYLVRQSAWVVVGIISLFIVASIDYHVLSEHIPWFYLGAAGLLIYTLAFGRVVSGSQSWISIGPARFQPSELAKLIVVIALARYLSELRSRQYMTFAQVVKAVIICGVPMLLIALQPDLGTCSTYLPVFAMGVFIRGVRPVVLISLILAFVLVLPVSWFFLKDYQKDRIATFVNPEMDPLGRGYQVIQSKIAIGSGGFWGKGIFQGSQNQLGFLPTRHTDFIFSVVGEELGFLGVIVTLGLLVFIIFRSIYNARTARDNLGLFIVMGIVGIFVYHMIVNVGMVIGFMPTTGIPLPFLSYGGSSVLTAFIALGLVISVRRCRYVN
jgi:rod shape determining protein RodA